MSFDTACFSMYSDMSNRTRCFCDPNRNSARRRATSVLPTPAEPRKMKEALGRVGEDAPTGGAEGAGGAGGGGRAEAGAAERARDGADGLVLTDDAPHQDLFHVDQDRK